jgi:hypothetical protein
MHRASILPVEKTINVAVAGFVVAVVAHAVLVLHTLQLAVANTFSGRLLIV